MNSKAKKLFAIALTFCLLLSVWVIVPPMKVNAAYNINGGSSSSATFIIDPGHGGSDPGACSLGRQEAADVLNLSKRVGELIIASGESVAFTRVTDITQSLGTKCAIANAGNFRYFLSIHRNAGGGRGIETYYYNGLSSSSTSAQFATRIQNAMINTGIWVNRGVKSANFAVIRDTNMTAALVEVGFIDTASDNAIFANNFETIARSIASGMLAQVGKTLYIAPTVDYVNVNGNAPLNLGDNFYGYIKHQSTGLYLTNESKNLIGAEPVYSAKQLWRFARQSDGSYMIVSQTDSTVIDVNGGGSANGTNVQTWASNNSAAQRFYIYFFNSAYYIKPTYTNNVFDMDASSKNIQIYGEAADAVAHKFVIMKTDMLGTNPANIGTGFTAYIQNPGSKRLLTNTGGVIQGQSAAYTDSQKWTFDRQADGSYKITSVADGKCMDVNGAGISAGTAIQTWASNTSDAQHFFIYKVDGTYYFSPRNSVLVLDMNYSTYNMQLYGSADASVEQRKYDILRTDGTVNGLSPVDIGTDFEANIKHLNNNEYLTKQSDNNVVTASANGSNEQLWRFERLNDGSYKITSVADGQGLDVYDFNVTNGTNISVYSYHGGANQRFFIYRSGNSYFFKPYHANKVWDIDSASHNLQIYGELDTASVYRQFAVYSSSGTQITVENPGGGGIIPKATANLTVKDGDNCILGVPTGINSASLKNMFENGAAITVVSSTGSDDTIGTGTTVSKDGMTLTIVITGDIDGDGIIGTSDLLRQKLSIKGKTELSGAFKLAADYNSDGVVSSADNIGLRLSVKNRT